jgi:hypothetical protein
LPRGTHRGGLRALFCEWQSILFYTLIDAAQCRVPLT